MGPHATVVGLCCDVCGLFGQDGSLHGTHHHGRHLPLFLPARSPTLTATSGSRSSTPPCSIVPGRWSSCLATGEWHSGTWWALQELSSARGPAWQPGCVPWPWPERKLTESLGFRGGCCNGRTGFPAVGLHAAVQTHSRIASGGTFIPTPPSASGRRPPYPRHAPWKLH